MSDDDADNVFMAFCLGLGAGVFFGSSTLAAGGGTVLVDVAFVELSDGLGAWVSVVAGATAAATGVADFEGSSVFAVTVGAAGLGWVLGATALTGMAFVVAGGGGAAT